MAKATKVITRRKKFQEVDVPLTKGKIELVGNTKEEIEGKTIKLDLTRQLRGKSVEVVVKVVNEKKGLRAVPIKMKLMAYFIRRMIRKKISYVEDSFEAPSQESMLLVKPFLITRKRVSKAVRKALRNRAKNWLEDYVSQKKDEEIFNDILSNRMQKPLSLVLKKTYPLSLCEIRVLEIKRPLEKSEIPEKVAIKAELVSDEREDEGFIDQMAEIEAEKVKAAEDEMKKTQKEAVETEKKIEEEIETEIEDVKKIDENIREVKDEVKEIEENEEKSDDKND
jgi:ribosomal protein S3AE